MTKNTGSGLYLPDPQNGVMYVVSLEQAPALPANIRLWWKQLKVTNTLAYYRTGSITDVKCVTVQGCGVYAIANFLKALLMLQANKPECFSLVRPHGLV